MEPYHESELKSADTDEARLNRVMQMFNPTARAAIAKNFQHLASTFDPPARSFMMEDIEEAAKRAGFTRTVSCCGTPLKTCSNDEWKGNLESFVGNLLEILKEKE